MLKKLKKIFATNDETKFALIDDDVYETIQEMNLKFCIQPNGYFISTSHIIKLPGMEKKKCLLLHRFVWILKTCEEPSRTVDHIDINPANNQFENLRLATSQQQKQNRDKLRTNTSGYIGVFHLHHVDKRRKKNNVHDYWKACIHRLDGKNEVKLFPFTENGLQHAAMWRDDHAREYYGRFHGELNFPMPSD